MRRIPESYLSGRDAHESMPGAPSRLVDTRPRAERANRDELRRLLDYLRGRGWTLRRQIRHDLQIKDDPLRALVRASEIQRVIYRPRGAA